MWLFLQIVPPMHWSISVITKCLPIGIKFNSIPLSVKKCHECVLHPGRKASQDASITSSPKTRAGLANETGALYEKGMRGSDRGHVHLDWISSLKCSLISFFNLSLLSVCISKCNFFPLPDKINRNFAILFHNTNVVFICLWNALLCRERTELS